MSAVTQALLNALADILRFVVDAVGMALLGKGIEVGVRWLGGGG